MSNLANMHEFHISKVDYSLLKEFYAPAVHRCKRQYLIVHHSSRQLEWKAFHLLHFYHSLQQRAVTKHFVGMWLLVYLRSSLKQSFDSYQVIPHQKTIIGPQQNMMLDLPSVSLLSLNAHILQRIQVQHWLNYTDHVKTLTPLQSNQFLQTSLHLCIPDSSLLLRDLLFKCEGVLYQLN